MSLHWRALLTFQGDVIIIQKALGRENIDEVIKLSEDYKNQERELFLNFVLFFPFIFPHAIPNPNPAQRQTPQSPKQL